MSQEHPSLRLLREVHRVERLAHRFPEPADPEETWVALHTFPLESDDAPGWLDRLYVPRTHAPLLRTYGKVVRFRRVGFFSTVSIPFTGIALRGDGEAVAFRAKIGRAHV